MIQLTATPAKALFDDLVHIRATGLTPFQIVLLQAALKDENGNLFHSYAYYRADENGEVELEHASALGGDYVGVHPTGLFWSLKPETKFTELLKRDVINSPFQIQLKLYDSDFTMIPGATAPPRVSLILERRYVAPGVTRVQVREGHVRGALFVPPGEGHFPGVINLFGNFGKLVESRASLLASHGFVALALAYCDCEDLPSQLKKVDLEYFEEATNFLLRHPKVLGPGIGVLSISKGAEIGLSMAIHLKQVIATVLINRPNFVALIPQAQGHFLFIVGEDDKAINSKVYAWQATEQLKRNGKNNWTLLSYPGAGHLIEPPYTPLCCASEVLSFQCFMHWGGQVVPHAAAQEHSWKEIQKFLRKRLLPVVTSQL